MCRELGVSHQRMAVMKRTKNLHEETEKKVLSSFEKLGFDGGEIQQLLKQRFEESKAQPPTTTSDRQTNILIRLTDLQDENNQLKRHIEALEMNVQLLTEKYESVLNYSLNT
jgi:Mg2+ and Co2+ transporter CorA